MDALDGNAIGGDLLELLGQEITGLTGACRHCGTRTVVAELTVYACAPGKVVRCRACGKVVMVFIRMRAQVRGYIDDFELAPGVASG